LSLTTLFRSVKATHHLSKAFQHGQPPHLWKKIPRLCGGARAPNCMFEGGNFVKSKSDTCDQYPLKTLQPHKLCDSAAEPSLPTSDLFIILFLRKLCAICICLLQFAFCVCTKKSRLGCSCLKFVTQLFLHGPSIIITCITWVMQ